MIESLIAFLEHVMVPYGALGVFAAAVTEEIIAIIPSGAVLLAAGFIFLHSEPFGFGFVTKLFFVIVIPASLGMTLGSLFVYGLGFIAGRPAIDKFGRWFGVSWRDVEEAEKRFGKTSADEITLIVLRAIPFIPNTAVSAVCGLIRFPFWKYTALSVIGLAFRALIFASVGAEAGVLYDEYERYFEQAENYVLVGFALVAIMLLFILFARKRLRRT